MIDIAPLRPTDGTPAALAAAITRCGIAGRGALAEIERLKSRRVELLHAGLPGEVDENLGELMRAMAGATQIGELLDQLQAQQAASNEHSAGADPRASAVDAIAACSIWWRQHGPTVTAGAQLAVAAIAAVITVARSASPDTAVPVVSNVSPFPPRPAA